MKVRLNTRAVWDRLARQNMSQNEMARRLGVTSGYVSQLINSKRCPSPGLRVRLQEVLGGASFQELFIVVDNDQDASA